MNRKDIVESEQHQAPVAKRQNFWEKYGGAPLASIMRNSKMTPVILFVLAVAPFVIAAWVLVLVFLLQ